ncbi:cell wall-binding repeat-containing protein [Rossellomorea aquimaris]|uniref:Cell wall-binding repeat-containing protein n=2 Tax=Bacillaceae TaxID=186817 RepID=A0A5D4TKA0_9BACI|nr:cell wall-binding repeat-containing protein [Rossellomorea aquimaris]
MVIFDGKIYFIYIKIRKQDVIIMKYKYLSILLVLSLIFNLTEFDDLALADGAKPTVESITINNSEVTSGDTVKVIVKIKEYEEYRYMNLMYNSPVLNQDQVITVSLDYDEPSNTYIGELPITDNMKSGEYLPFSLAFYGSTSTSVNRSELEQMEAVKFAVKGTSGKSLVESIQADNKEAIAGEVVTVSLKVSDTKGIRYFNISYHSPITNRSLNVSMNFNSETQSFEGIIPISSLTESGLYKPWRVTSYEYGGNSISFSGFPYEELLAGGSFNVSGTDPGDVIDNIIVDKKQLTVGETIHFTVNAPKLIDIRYMNVNYTSPITGESFHVDLYNNNETGIFEGSRIIPEGFELGTYTLFLIAIYEEHYTTALYRDEFTQLEKGDFIIYKDETEPSFIDLSVDKKEAGTGERVRIQVGASDNSMLQNAVINYITPHNNRYSLDLYYDRNSGKLFGDIPIDNESPLGKWQVESISIKDIHQNEVIVKADSTDLVNGEFTIIDTTSPHIPQVNEVTDQSTEITGTSEAYSEVAVKTGTTVIGTGVVSETGDFNIPIPIQAAGTELTIYAVDKAGNQSEPAVVRVEDRTVPEKPVINSVTDQSTEVTGKAEAGTEITLKTGTTVIGTGVVSETGNFNISIPKQAAGTELMVYAVDKAGNQSESAVVRVEDRTAPEQPEVSGVTDQDESITGLAEADATITVRADNKEIGQAVVNGSGKFTVIISTQPVGSKIEIIAKDLAGNSSQPLMVTVQDKKPELYQVVGKSRYSTAVEVSQKGWKVSETVILVNGNAIADGLTATPLAAAHDAPILLSQKEVVSPDSLSEMKRLGAKNIVLIGGNGVISASVEKDLKAKGYNVSRIGGADRYATSLLIAKQLDKLIDVKDAFLANGRGEADALSIAAHSGAVKQPIILVERSTVPAATFEWLKTENLSNAFFIGGTAVIEQSIIKKMDAITSKRTESNRISGLNRHDTNAKIIQRFYPENQYQSILIAKSESEKLIDALSAGPLAAKLGVPVMIVSEKGLDKAQISTMLPKQANYIYQVGGGINREVVQEVLHYMN